MSDGLKDFLIALGVIAVIVGLSTLVLWFVNDELEEQYQRCRDAGGIPIQIKGSVNCATSEGGWIDAG